MSTDPFGPAKATVDPRYGEQIGAMADFFDLYLKADGRPRPSSVRYQVLNGGGWQSAPTWPPPGETSCVYTSPRAACWRASLRKPTAPMSTG
jgi:predicted acyl esterase